jgi:hypothetical protein
MKMSHIRVHDAVYNTYNSIKYQKESGCSVCFILPNLNKVISIRKPFLALSFLNQMKPFLHILHALLPINLHILLLYNSNILWFGTNTFAYASGNDTDFLALLKFKESISKDSNRILTLGIVPLPHNSASGMESHA